MKFKMFFKKIETLLIIHLGAMLRETLHSKFLLRLRRQIDECYHVWQKEA